MDDAKLEVYINLIKQLSNCPNAERLNILQENEELIDQGLLQVLEVIETKDKELERQQPGSGNFPWLQTIIQELAEYIKPQEINIEEYQNFLKELIFVEYESNESKEIYTILDCHQEKLNNIFAYLLKKFVTDIFSLEKNRRIVTAMARLVENLCIHISNYPRGSQENNLEIALIGLQSVVEMRPREIMKEEWAITQKNLGDVYSDRTRGNRAENLELAITAYNLSLEILTREAFPQLWAQIQNKLGNIYSDRIRGDSAENLELALAAFQQALEVRIRETFPEQWAITQNNLGLTYVDRIRGDRAENLELALAAELQSLEILTREAFPEQWAKTTINLGNAYLFRIKGDRAENLELALATFQQSLEVLTREAFPKDWIMVKINLGRVYSDRIKGEKSENLELAIKSYKLSLEVLTCEAFPQIWAITQIDLGDVYRERIRGEKTKNLELAIAAYRLSLEILNPTAFPLECLRVGRNLGETASLIEDWEMAIESYKLAIKALGNIRLEVLNPQRQQEILSNNIDVYHSIVRSYLNLNQPDKALEYVEQSKTSYLAQSISKKNIYPTGNIPQPIITELDRLRRAIVGEEQRLAIQEQNRNKRTILTLDARENTILIDYAFLNHLREELNQKSSELIERELKIINPNLSLNQNNKDVFLSVIQPLLDKQNNPILIDYAYLNQLKEELSKLIDCKITPIDPNFSLNERVKSISLNKIQSLIDKKTVILEWYMTKQKILVFIITVEELKVWQSLATEREKLIDIIDDYCKAYQTNKTEWIKNLNSRLNNFSEILYIDQVLELIPKSCDRLIIIPHWFLHIIPLHCLLLKDEKFLYQRFSQGVGYIPSCQLLELLQFSHYENFEHFFAIKNPTRKDLKPLLGANLEIERIGQQFDADKTIIIGESEASEEILEKRREELQLSHCIHFSCHGKFNNKSPRDSALMLADTDGNLGESANLSLAKIFQKLDIRQCRLVTLSACESGIVDSGANSISDEYVGLPSGFLFAGSSCVVSTLWTVDPLATTLFMTKFYHNLKRISVLDQGSIAIISNKTQTWLRTLKSQKLKRIKNSQKFHQLLDQVFESKRERKKFQDLLEAAVKRQPYPFEHSYYWAAFIATGV